MPETISAAGARNWPTRRSSTSSRSASASPIPRRTTTCPCSSRRGAIRPIAEAEAPRPSVDRWVFLDRRRFAAKAPAKTFGFPWISLDLSSESRLFNGLRGNRERFFRRLVSHQQRPNEELAVLACGQRRIVHRASLTWFLIFCNELPDRSCQDRRWRRLLAWPDLSAAATFEQRIECNCKVEGRKITTCERFFCTALLNKPAHYIISMLMLSLAHKWTDLPCPRAGFRAP